VIAEKASERFEWTSHLLNPPILQTCEAPASS